MTTIPSEQQLQHLLELAQDAEQSARQMSESATRIAHIWEQKAKHPHTIQNKDPILEKQQI
jgi:hypothetical protein